jgi:hypothetical protein
MKPLFFIRDYVIFCCLVAAGVFAQQPTGEITGIVTDATGAAIPGAGVEAVNASTGLRWNAVSTSDGTYAFSILPPGTYGLQVRKQGFETLERTGIALSIGQVVRLDLTLKIGSQTQTVVVTGSAPLLESETASTGQVISTKPINDLPLNGRNFLQLAKLTAGVAEPKPGDRAAAGGSFQANGVRAQLNNFLLDGVDNNAKIVDQQNSSPVVIQPSVDALQEFKVETNNYSAEYGYSAGAVVNASIKSGTNQLHGDAFEFLRNDYLDARNFFSNPTARKPVLQQNQFGGTLGGPIIRNRAFFFGSYERTSTNRGSTYVVTVPTAAIRSGDFTGQPTIYNPATTVQTSPGVYTRTAFANNRISPTLFDPAAAKLLSLIPLPTNPSASINNYVSSPTNTVRANRLDFKQDTQFSPADTLFARYSYFGANAVTYGPFPAPLVGSTSFQTAPKEDLGNGAATGETHIFSPAVVNEARVGYNRIQDFLSPFVKDTIAAQYGLGGIPTQPGATGLPSISISGFSNLGEATFLPNQKISEVITAEDHVSWTTGRHLLRFGGSYRWVRSWFNISSSARGSYNFSGAFTQNPSKPAGTGSGFADFLLGIPAGASLSNFVSGDLRYHYFGGFIQDDWKLTPNLTINLGVRYELWTQPIERHDQQANFLTNLARLIYPNDKIPAGAPSLTAPIPSGVGRRSLMKTDTNNVAPRLGLALRATSNTVLRAGAGVFFADDPAIGASARPVANPPFFRSVSYPTDQITPVLHLATGFPSDALAQNVNISAATLSAFAVDLKQGYVYHWSFGVEHQLYNWLLDLNYVGTRGNDLPLTYNVNQPLAGPGSVASRRPYAGLGDINFTRPMDTTSYNALETRVEHRYQNGLALLGSYTFSRSIDIGGESLIGDLSLRNAANIKAERGLSSGDQRHRFVSSVLYDLPVGTGRRFQIPNRIVNAIIGNWQLNAIVTARTGQPFTPTLGTSTANTGAPRPDRLRDGNLPSDQRTITAWFDKTAFAQPALYRFGNAGRNILIAPGAVNLDASVFKDFPLRVLGEQGQLQFRAESFNALNHPQFGTPNSRVDLAQGGTITGLSANMREVQFGLKLMF